MASEPTTSKRNLNLAKDAYTQGDIELSKAVHAKLVGAVSRPRNSKETS